MTNNSDQSLLLSKDVAFQQGAPRDCDPAQIKIDLGDGRGPVQVHPAKWSDTLYLVLFVDKDDPLSHIPHQMRKQLGQTQGIFAKESAIVLHGLVIKLEIGEYQIVPYVMREGKIVGRAESFKLVVADK